MTTHSVCIHAHFYQPPREDPITGLIPFEAGAAPYPNWNERIHNECYRPNAELGNFERVSFNLGPTLCDWLQTTHPETLRLIIAQDRINWQRHGVGNAMAQAYNHTILPLAKRADKVTQIAWGIADFEYRFGRKPQGMWLPETAVDLETLDIMAQAGIEFTILAPWQAETNHLDHTEPYQVMLPEGRAIKVFFYHRDLSGGISFQPNWTTNADIFARQYLARAFNPQKSSSGEPQLLLVASDGELYGHHQPFRDYFLAHLVDGASRQAGLHTTYPALWLRENPPRRSIRIREDTSWSCHHGVTRWMGECACTPGDARWKVYLRRAFDHLGDKLDDIYVHTAQGLNIDPWLLRDRYIHVIMGHISADELTQEHAGKRLSLQEIHQMRLLLKAQYERQRMFTSCGWFFEDFSRIEPRNNLAYAAQAVWLTKLATGIDLAPWIQEDLKFVVSNCTLLRGDIVFQQQLERVEVIA